MVSPLCLHSPPQVEQACHALSALAMEDALIAHLVRADVLTAICSLLLSEQPEILVSVLRVIASLALASDSVAARLCNTTTVPLLRNLYHSTHMMVSTVPFLSTLLPAMHHFGAPIHKHRMQQPDTRCLKP